MADAEKPLFNDVGNGVDRLFRSIEMLGITALVGVLVTTYGDDAVTSVMFIGTLLATIYLTEPAINAVGYWIIRKVGLASGAFFALFVLFLWGEAILASTPYLISVPKRIAKTISMAG
jgi:hypothetical protein